MRAGGFLETVARELQRLARRRVLLYGHFQGYILGLDMILREYCKYLPWIGNYHPGG